VHVIVASRVVPRRSVSTAIAKVEKSWIPII
jgi:hypothetical protein